MARQFDKKDISLFSGKPKKKLWTAVIPAAGVGSRLQYNHPKILFPVAGRSMLEWLVDLLEGSCEHFVIVLSPLGYDEVKPRAERLLGDRVSFAIQEKPYGMAHALKQSLAYLQTEQTLVIWCDQISLKKNTIITSQKVHEQTEAALTMSIYSRSDPYIHMELNRSGRLLRVLQKREGDVMPREGKSDAGLFLLRSSSLRELFKEMEGCPGSRGAITGEMNFLPMLPDLENNTNSEAINLLQIVDYEETVGINNRKEAEFVAEVLKTRRHNES